MEKANFIPTPEKKTSGVDRIVNVSPETEEGIKNLFEQFWY
jgi:hypothetical protein